MNQAWLVVLALASGCWSSGGYYGGGGNQSFEVDDGDCSLASTVALSGSSMKWTGCRLRYNDYTGVYTWQLTTPGTTGTWSEQGPGWFTLSFNLDSPQNAVLPLATDATDDPRHVAVDAVVFSYAPVASANVGGNGNVSVGANIIYPGGVNSALDAHLAITIPGFGVLSGEASAAIDSTPTPVADAAIADLPSVTPGCNDDAGPCD